MNSAFQQFSYFMRLIAVVAVLAVAPSGHAISGMLIDEKTFQQSEAPGWMMTCSLALPDFLTNEILYTAVTVIDSNGALYRDIFVTVDGVNLAGSLDVWRRESRSKPRNSTAHTFGPDRWRKNKGSGQAQYLNGI